VQNGGASASYVSTNGGADGTHIRTHTTHPGAHSANERADCP